MQQVGSRRQRPQAGRRRMVDLHQLAAPEGRQRAAVAGAQRGLADQRQRQTVIGVIGVVAQGTAQLVADQQAGQIVQAVRGRQPAVEHQRARREQQRGQRFGALHRRDAAVEGRVVSHRTGLARRPPQDGMRLQRGIELAGHEGAEGRDAAILHLHPFAVRARQQQPAARGQRRLGGQRADDLRLFAAHHVGPLARPAHPRHDVQAAAVAQVDGLQPRGQRRRIGRRVDVARQHPALRAAHHAASQQRRLRHRRHPVAGDAAQRGVEAAIGQMQDAPVALSRFEQRATGPQPVGAQR